jgi:hypothetical protein
MSGRYLDRCYLKRHLLFASRARRPSWLMIAAHLPRDQRDDTVRPAESLRDQRPSDWHGPLWQRTLLG